LHGWHLVIIKESKISNNKFARHSDIALAKVALVELKITRRQHDCFQASAKK
jgi:hypothetical protein